MRKSRSTTLPLLLQNLKPKTQTRTTLSSQLTGTPTCNKSSRHRTTITTCLLTQKKKMNTSRKRKQKSRINILWDLALKEQILCKKSQYRCLSKTPTIIISSSKTIATRQTRSTLVVPSHRKVSPLTLKLTLIWLSARTTPSKTLSNRLINSARRVTLTRGSRKRKCPKRMSST